MCKLFRCRHFRLSTMPVRSILPDYSSNMLYTPIIYLPSRLSCLFLSWVRLYINLHLATSPATAECWVLEIVYRKIDTLEIRYTPYPPLLQILQSKCNLYQHIWYDVCIVYQCLWISFSLPYNWRTTNSLSIAIYGLWLVSWIMVNFVSGLVSASVPKVIATVAVMSKYYSLPVYMQYS